MPSIDNLTLGERANMRSRLRIAREAFGDRITPGHAKGFINPVESERHLTARDQAVLDVARILERILD